MTLIGRDVLTAAGRRNRPLYSALTLWAATVADADWHRLEDVRKSYPSADGVKLPSGTVVTIFNVKGGHYRLLTAIDYSVQAVEVLEVLTHAEYDKNQWKGHY